MYYTAEKVEIIIMYVVLIRKLVVYVSVYVVIINTKCYKSMLYIDKKSNFIDAIKKAYIKYSNEYLIYAFI